MAERIFKSESTLRAGKRVPAVVLRCGHKDCMESETFVTEGFRSPPNKTFVSKHFASRGWNVGRTPTKDRCPEHNGRARRKQEQEITEMPSQPTVTPPKAEPPRQMNREDRRIIHAMLSDVYIDDIGYSIGWTDEKVATDLGVPRAWVEEVRAQFFGDAMSNPEIDRFLADLAQLRVDNERVSADVQRVANAALGMQDRLKTIKASLDALEQLGNRVRAITEIRRK